MLALVPGVVPHQNRKRSRAANLRERMHRVVPFRKRVMLRLHEANQRVDLIPRKLVPGPLAEFVSTRLKNPGQAGHAAVPSQHHGDRSDEPQCLYATGRPNPSSFGGASRCVHHWLAPGRPTGSRRGYCTT